MEGHQAGQGLKNMPYKKRLGDMGLFSLEERQLQADLTAACGEAIEKIEPGSSLRIRGRGHELKKRCSVWIQQKTISL